MPLVTLLDAELLAAVAAAEWLQASVDPLVLQESLSGFKVLPTDEAQEGPVVGVDALVADHVAVLAEGTAAHFTGIFLFPCVDNLMVLQQGSITEGFITHIALKGTLSSMHRPHMYL